MNLMFALTFLVAVLIWFSLGVVRSGIRIWLDHKARVEALESPEGGAPAPGGPYENYRLTGVLLTALGLGAVALGWYEGHGATAVGIYVGGIICALLGVLIVLLGLVIGSFEKTGDSRLG